MVQVKVEQGWLAGEQLKTVQGDGQYYSFKGIPYAEPPVGKLRFKAPRPPLPWEGVRKATDHGPKCPQMDIFSEEIQLGNEDCLHLNVYTPELTPTSPLPVMVFIHGGGFKSGSGNMKNCGPDFLVPHGVILVTLNYRLEVLGFLCLDTEEVPGNAGLKDQVAALRWIRDNITNFGGDPENVTVIGQNAGSTSAILHMLSPMSKGLLKRIISMSGVPFCDWSIAFEPQKRAFVLGKQLGLETNDPNRLLEYLQKLPVEKIINTNPTLMFSEENYSNKYKMAHFAPVVEKQFGQEGFLTENPLIAVKYGRMNDVDVLIGHTSEEALLKLSIYRKKIKEMVTLYNRYTEILVPRKIQLICTPAQILVLSNRIHRYYFKDKPITMDIMANFIRYLSQSTFCYDINNFIHKLPKVGNGRRYMYNFSCVSSRNVYGNPGMKYGIAGASHLDDLMYLMHGYRYNLKLEKNTKEYDLVQRTCALFTNFAKCGNPTPDCSLGVIWPEYDNVSQSYMDIGDNLTPGTKPIGEAFEFWRSIYKELKMVQVKVEQGWLAGEQLNTFQGDGQYYSFKGIPYAEPPVGKLRFKLAVSEEKWLPVLLSGNNMG